MSIFDDLNVAVASPSPSPPPAPTLPPPAQPVCPSCNSTWFWIDGYRREHCYTCTPPPAAGLVVDTIGEPTLAENVTTQTDDEFETSSRTILEDSLASLTDDERLRYREFLAKRQNANESPGGIEWRALVDVRFACGHWPDELENEKATAKKRFYFSSCSTRKK